MRASSRITTVLGVALAMGWAGAGPSFSDDCNLSFKDGETCTDLPCPFTAATPYCYAPPCPEGTQPVTCPFAGTVQLFSGDPPYTLCHPYPQPRPAASKQCTTQVADNHFVTKINTGEGILPPSNPWDSETFPGTNLLPSVYTNAFDGNGNEMPNTLPSTPAIPYNLHDGDPVVSEIDPTSPVDDLRTLFTSIVEEKIPEVIELTRNAELTQTKALGPWPAHQGELDFKIRAIVKDLRSALDILEGEPVPYRYYSGFPLLHYMGPDKVKQVRPIVNDGGEIVGGNVDVHQIWYGQHVEADTAFIDPSPVMKDQDGNAIDVPWTVTYTVDVLNHGHDDFSPFVTYTDYLPGASNEKPPNVGMDQSFFDMEDGTRTVFKIKMTYAKYLNLVYTWGWRMHPPRVQVMENAGKTIGAGPLSSPNVVTCPQGYANCTLPQLEQRVFCKENSDLGPDDSCENVTPCSVICGPGEPRFDGEGRPTACEQAKLYAISRIGDSSPAKRMWTTLQEAMKKALAHEFGKVREIVGTKTMPAFHAWQDRTHLPCFARAMKSPSPDQPVGRCVDPCLDGEPGENCRRGLDIDPESDITIFYVNNTIYGQLVNRENPDPDLKAGGWVRWPNWETRWDEWKAEEDAFPATHHEWEEAYATWLENVKNGDWSPEDYPPPLEPRAPVGPPILHVTAYNGDTWPHSYTIADFGGSRGWENQFKSSVKVAGSGCWFTFGRAYWWMPVGAPNGFLCVPPAPSADGEPGLHEFEVQFNFEPSRRLRFYQFDPMHHDVAVYSIH